MEACGADERKILTLRKTRMARKRLWISRCDNYGVVLILYILNTHPFPLLPRIFHKTLDSISCYHCI